MTNWYATRKPTKDKNQTSECRVLGSGKFREENHQEEEEIEEIYKTYIKPPPN